ncbi:unnamed protein product [Penicillium olsonii]|uniref:Uncharacterized protein n=1 Tax=Penicillium olsonii TaxID=99116 RepID=A0A9W4I0E1_PENOL|nr:unnamed protein product [Penicillium olsonii]CAG8179693.1 unnamed protein product [Penicillium olsonii]
MFIGYGFPQTSLGVLAKYHAGSLHHLRFRYTTLGSDLGMATGSEIQCHSAASILDIIDLAIQFPNLLSLGINLDWTAEYELPYDILANIVQHTRLRHLELNLPNLSRCDSRPWPFPNLSKTICRAPIESFDRASLRLQSVHFVLGDLFPFKRPPNIRSHMEAFVVGERDSVGQMRFDKLWQYTQVGVLMFSGSLVPRVPPHQLRGHWPANLRQDVEGRISDLFCGRR